ncbi:MAG: putative transcriptional regulator, AsnC family [Gaiellaceae bacterium]|nr:putative transcriptional regulator, AsnC family [Gaiellaceae bacterium]
MGEDDVRGEEYGVRERERDADGLGVQLDVGQEVHPDDGQAECHPVSRCPGPDRGEGDDGEELDGRDRPQRQRVDGDVEARVHHREDGPECDEESLRSSVHPRKRAPRLPPQREYRRGANDAKPGDAERLDSCEEKNRERGSQVVEDGAADEVRLGRSARREVLAVHTAIFAARVASWNGRSTELEARVTSRARLGMASTYEANLLDPINLRLLAELQRDGRIGFAELGRRVGMSAPAVAERVSRLERAGVITGYRAELDPVLLGFPVSAIVRIRPSPGQLQRVREVAADSPEVAECYRITGDDCYLIRLHLRSIDDLEEILDRFTPHGQTTTSIVHSTPVPRRSPPLEP